MEYGYISLARLSCWLHSESSLVPTRRQPGEGSIYQRESDGRWIGVVDLGWVNGKRVRKTVSAKTLKDLRPKYKALQKQVESGVTPDDGTVEQWMNHWLDNIAAKKLRPSTLTTYRRYVDKWVIPSIGKKRLDKLRAEHLEALYADMEDAGRSDATQRQVHAIMHRALSIAEKRDKVMFNAAQKVEEPPSIGQGSHGKFTLPEAKLILRSIGSDPMRSRWSCALLEGLRQGEALGLTWERVSFDEGLIIIEQAIQQVPGKGLQVVGLKSNAAHRAIPMLEPVRALLWEERRDTGYVWGGDKPIGPRADWQAWKDMLAEVGVPHRPLHAARATCGSLLEDAGVSPTLIAEILGHAQVSTTQRHYLHGDELRRRSAMDALTELVYDD